MKKIIVAGLLTAILSVSGISAHAYPSGSGAVGSFWGVVTGFEKNITITAKGISESNVGALRVSVTNPKGFSRVVGNVIPSESGEFTFKLAGFKWVPGIYKITIASGDSKQTMAVNVSSKRVNG